MRNAPTLLALALALSLAACQQTVPADNTAVAAPANAPVEVAPAPAKEAAAPAIHVASGIYALDPAHTLVLAQWNHLGFSNPSANFGGAKGTLSWNAEDPAKSSVEVTLPLSGLDSFSAEFDQHLRSADFFDAARFPQATFKSTGVTADGANRFKVTGDLTLKGITKPVTLDVTLNGAGEHPMTKAPSVGFDATGTLKRSDFGLGLHVPMVGDEVKLRITTEASITPAAETTQADAAAKG